MVLDRLFGTATMFPDEFFGFSNRLQSFVRRRQSCGSIGQFFQWLAVRVGAVVECRELSAAQS
jgi:hypothetical protein